ncbi:MAG: quinate 5-dehydrogenase [Fimbriimonas sp.]
MKRVVSVSLGTSSRDKANQVQILGEEFSLERIGTDGDLAKFAAMFRELDGKVDALGVGGADIYVVIEDKRYAFRQIKQLASGAKITPVVDGSGLKHTLERETIRSLQREGIVDFRKEKVLLVSAVDRFGMAQALVEAGADVIYGDLMFALGMKLPLRKYSQVKTVGSIILPLITRLPFKWFYPTGEKQKERKPMFGDIFNERTLVAGDWHYIRRYAPHKMPGKTVLTNTVRTADLDLLREMGVRRVITTTPVIGGESFGNNVMEGVIVALLGKRPEELREQDYLDVLAKLQWKPNVIDLHPSV